MYGLYDSWITFKHHLSPQLTVFIMFSHVWHIWFLNHIKASPLSTTYCFHYVQPCMAYMILESHLSITSLHNLLFSLRSAMYGLYDSSFVWDTTDRLVLSQRDIRKESILRPCPGNSPTSPELSELLCCRNPSSYEPPTNIQITNTKSIIVS